MRYRILILSSNNQFVYPDPKGSELIFRAPFRDGVFTENQFAGLEVNQY